MGDGASILNEIISGVSGVAVWNLVVWVVIAAILGLIYTYIQRAIGWFTFKTNSFVSLGRKVKVDDFTGSISSVGLDFIVVENDEKYYLIPTRRWQFSKWYFEKE